MWNEENLEEDYQKIKNNSFEDLNVFKKPAPKEDSYLLYRYNYFRLLSYINQNKVDSIKNLGNSSAALILPFLMQYNYAKDLILENEEPPFDFCVLTFFHPKINPNYSFFISYLDHFLKLTEQLSDIPDDQEIYLCDQLKRSDFLIKPGKALSIVRKRIDYIVEIILSILLESNMTNLINSFLNDYKPWDFVTSADTLSFIGRVALSVGNGPVSDQCFCKVKTNEQLFANSGFTQLYHGSFAEALEFFGKGGESSPQNLDPVRRYNGEKLEEYISKSKSVSNKK
ncbi:hypothetical protein GPJ56_003198 [Histomonas meleagridis]|uniref:uncharacterized protein n=1 Tax=Histomonas meleagridis TaxID=135588 RepID=UPI003559382A|nr:hypothetical protein GPJ56_003198 [Histomonas meleagridis]KAH0801231.1 hypothetical protein GO595_005826 [Histomonas meleagridis]